MCVFFSFIPDPLAEFARMLDGGKGRLKEAVEAVKNRGAGALHQAARYGRTAMCAYMVEELQVDIDAADELGDLFASSFCGRGIPVFFPFFLNFFL